MITLGFEGLATLVLTPTRKARLRKRVLENLSNAVEPVVNEIKAGTPVESGALRESVRTESNPSEMVVVIKAGGVPETSSPALNGTVYDEALLTEYGTIHQAPRPFFWPVINAHEADFAKIGESAVTDAFED
jgi:hypothetical protein